MLKSLENFHCKNCSIQFVQFLRRFTEIPDPIAPPTKLNVDTAAIFLVSMLHIFISLFMMFDKLKNIDSKMRNVVGCCCIYRRRPRRPPFLRVESDGIGVTSSMRPIFMLERAKARNAD